MPWCRRHRPTCDSHRFQVLLSQKEGLSITSNTIVVSSKSGGASYLRVGLSRYRGRKNRSDCSSETGTYLVILAWCHECAQGDEPRTRRKDPCKKDSLRALKDPGTGTICLAVTGPIVMGNRRQMRILLSSLTETNAFASLKQMHSSERF